MGDPHLSDILIIKKDRVFVLLKVCVMYMVFVRRERKEQEECRTHKRVRIFSTLISEV